MSEYPLYFLDEFARMKWIEVDVVYALGREVCMNIEKKITIVVCSVLMIAVSLYFCAYLGVFSQRSTGRFSSSGNSTLPAVTGNPDPVTETSQTSQVRAAVYICGAVRREGLYYLEPGQRVYDLIELAGGFRRHASRDCENLAREPKDGEQIRIYTKKQWRRRQKTEASSSGTAAQQTQTALVNLNQASLTELMTLPGVGQSKAQAILDYRDTNGSFRQIEDIMQISGIKDGIFQKIKDKITV